MNATEANELRAQLWREHQVRAAKVGLAAFFAGAGCVGAIVALAGGGLGMAAANLRDAAIIVFGAMAIATVILAGLILLFLIGARLHAIWRRTGVKVVSKGESNGRYIVFREAAKAGTVLKECTYYEKPVLITFTRTRLIRVHRRRWQDLLTYGEMPDLGTLRTVRGTVDCAWFEQPQYGTDLVIVGPQRGTA